MTEQMIRDAYCRIRKIDQTIPDDVLDFMKDAAIEKLTPLTESSRRAIMKACCQHAYVIDGTKSTKTQICCKCGDETPIGFYNT